MVMLNIKLNIVGVLESDANGKTAIPATQSQLLNCIRISVISVSSKNLTFPENKQFLCQSLLHLREKKSEATKPRFFLNLYSLSI